MTPQYFTFQVCYAKELKEGFVEYTEQVVKLMVPLLKFYFHDDILLMNLTENGNIVWKNQSWLTLSINLGNSSVRIFCCFIADLGEGMLVYICL